MIPWILLGVAQSSGDEGEIRLYRRGDEFSLRVDNRELMNSRVHTSEDVLGKLACVKIADRPEPRVLIGGLGMGYTLRAVLQRLTPQGRVTVAELIPEVIEWNRGPMGDLTGHPLRDDRVTLRQMDVAKIIREAPAAYDAILLDVDNGPKALTKSANEWLYNRGGLKAAFAALRVGGVLGVWSPSPDESFTRRLEKIRFKVEEVRVRARGAHGGPRHTLWLAVRRADRSTEQSTEQAVESTMKQAPSKIGNHR